jgi:hypothetical protein
MRRRLPQTKSGCARTGRELIVSSGIGSCNGGVSCCVVEISVTSCRNGGVNGGSCDHLRPKEPGELSGDGGHHDRLVVLAGL